VRHRARAAEPVKASTRARRGVCGTGAGCSTHLEVERFSGGVAENSIVASREHEITLRQQVGQRQHIRTFEGYRMNVGYGVRESGDSTFVQGADLDGGLCLHDIENAAIHRILPLLAERNGI